MQQHPQQQQNMKEPKSEKTIFFENALYIYDVYKMYIHIIYNEFICNISNICIVTTKRKVKSGLCLGWICQSKHPDSPSE